MSVILYLVAASLLSACFSSCAGNGTSRQPSDFSLPEQGIIHEKITCKLDTGISYALYIPHTLPPAKGKSTTGNTRYPVMIALDPHGNGVLPLVKYKSLADRYGYILAGSNDSKNGLPPERIREIMSVLMQEIREMYPVDTSQVYLLGFSGGARVATITAMYYSKVAGVIGCGAGFGGGDQEIKYAFDYFGIVGTADFNLDEMVRLDEPLTTAGFRHFITTFPGEHAWPTASVLEDGFQWITLNAMKDGRLKRDDKLVSMVSAKYDSLFLMRQNCQQFIAAADAARIAISSLDGLVSTEHFKTLLSRLEKQAGYQSEAAYRQKVFGEEELEKKELSRAMQTEGLAWWKKTVARYDVQMKNPGGREPQVFREDSLKDKRVMSFLSLVCYMNASRSLEQQNGTAAMKIISVYELADAANPEPNYMRAVLLARKSEYKAALGQLKIATTKGFDDKARLTGQAEFRGMTRSDDWNDLLKTME